MGKLSTRHAVKVVWHDQIGVAAEVPTFGDTPTPVAGLGEVLLRPQVRRHSGRCRPSLRYLDPTVRLLLDRRGALVAPGKAEFTKPLGQKIAQHRLTQEIAGGPAVPFLRRLAAQILPF